MTNWWLIVRGYQNGQQQMFMLYSDHVTALRIASLVDPKILSPKKDFTVYEWINGAWSQQNFESPG
jgi:hypothetical protein